MAIVTAVLKKIEELALEEGARLPSERVLADECDVSRASMRNALKNLQSRGVLAAIQGSGYFLASQFAYEQAINGKDNLWNIQRVLQAMEARYYLEPKVLALSAGNMSREDISTLETCLVALSEATVTNDASSIIRLHRKFFKIILDLCPNCEFIRMLNGVRIPLDLMTSAITAATLQEKNKLFSEHVNLLQLIKRRDIDSIGDVSKRMNKLITELFIKHEDSIVF